MQMDKYSRSGFSFVLTVSLWTYNDAWGETTQSRRRLNEVTEEANDRLGTPGLFFRLI